MNAKRIIGVIISLFLVVPYFAVSADTPDIKSTVEDLLSNLKEASTAEQEDELVEIENQYNIIKAFDKNQSPWAEVTALMLTNEILNKQTLRRTCELTYLRGKTLSLSGSPSSELAALLQTFVNENDAIEADYDFDNMSVAEAASQYRNLEADLTAVYTKLLQLQQGASAESISLLADGVPYTGPVNSEIDDMISSMMADLMKSAGAVMFSTKDTWRDALDEFFSGDNIILMGSMFGADFADAVASPDATGAIIDYLTGKDILQEIVSSGFSDLFTGNADEVADGLADLTANIIDGIFNLPEMAGAKADFLASGLTSETIANAVKIIADAADPDVYARIINLNMFVGRYLALFENGEKASTPLVLDSTYATKTYDIKVSKNSFAASIINLVNTIVYNDEDATDESSKLISSDDEGKLKFTMSKNPDGTYYLYVYRSGDLNDDISYNSVYGFITKFQIDVSSSLVPVLSVSIRQGSEITIYVNSSTKLDILIFPSSATNKNVTWRSLNTSIVSVSSNGTITGKKVGTTTVTVTTEDGEHSDSIKVTVKNRPTIGTGTPSGPGVPPVTPPVKPDEEPIFKDVPKEHWASSEIEDFYKKGIIRGVTQDTFEPDRNLTRAELAIIITGILGVEPVKDGAVYSDSATHYAKEYISAATKYGLMIGFDDSTFMPDNPVTREQIIAVILRTIFFKEEILRGETPSATEVEERIIQTLGYDPRGTFTSYTDIDTTSPWARGLVEIAIAIGLIKGYEDNTVRPTINTTRAEAVVIMQRALFSE